MSQEQIIEDSLVTLDDLIIGGRKIYQRSDQFKFSIDAVLLAHFASYKKGASYLDLGITPLGNGFRGGLCDRIRN